jgi:hypothetical protein
MFRRARFSAAALMLVFFAACSSGDLGGILGGGGDTGSGSYSGEIRGTVDYVDTRDQFIELTNVSGYDSRLSNGSSSGSRARVYFDSQTPVEFQGKNYRPSDLERGDEIAIRASESGGRTVATSIAVLRNAGGSSSSSGTWGSGSGSYDTTVRGTVRYVDTGRRTIEIDEGSYNNRTVILDYSTDTYVDYNGRRYRPEDLERGDEIEVRVRDDNGRRVASSIMVTRNAAGGTSTTSDRSTVRGTVYTVDTARRTVTLDRASWTGARFQSGSSTSSVTIRYDSNVPVLFQGRTYNVTNLERGDEVEIDVRNLGGSDLLAERITVLRDKNSF